MHVGIDTDISNVDRFTVTFGADVDANRNDVLNSDKNSQLVNQREGGVGEKEMDIDMEVQDVSKSSSMVTEGNTFSSHSTPKEDKKEKPVIACSSNCSDSNSSPIETITSSDVTSWSLRQQDYSELFFLANNANNTAYSENNIGSGASTSASASAGGGDERENRETVHSAQKDETSGKSNTEKSEKGGKDKDKDKEREKVKEKRQFVPLLLEMTEPNPETPRGMDLWLSWFDGLKHSSDKLQSYL